jgi:hypothetical protein
MKTTLTNSEIPGEQEIVVHKNIRRFMLKRNEDESGISGVGYVAEGVQFSDGTCILHWTSVTPCTAIYRSPVELTHIHGHGGKTSIVWLDTED